MTTEGGDDPLGLGEETIAATLAGDPGHALTGAPARAPIEERGSVRRVGRYLLLERLGAGGMGVVFAAYDETLGRKVAVKLLRGLGSERGGARLRREAQSLARLSHPNVVQVYEFGETPQGEAYIVMEFVDGLTLGDWRAQVEPSRAQILEVFAAAGRGLAAAHAKGLVHRDFKPDNVMIASDGRVLVMDFGIARGEEGEPPVEPQGSREGEGSEGEALAAFGEGLAQLQTLRSSGGELSGEGVALTATGALMGTPAYMAPEQFRGQRADPRSDQFSYCVALFEALYGARPFSARTLLQLSARVSEGQLELPERDDVPAWLQAVVLRGLSTEPEARYPSMDALLDALGDDPSWRRRASLVALLSLALLVALALGLRAAEQRELARHAASCERAAGSIGAQWSPARQAALAKAFAGTRLPGAAEIYARVDARMSAYAAAWSSARRESCLAAGPEGEEDPRTLACLEEREATFGALLELWTTLDRPALYHAPLAAGALPAVDACSEAGALAQRVPPPGDPQLRAEVVALRKRATRLEALGIANSDEAGRADAEQLLAEAEALGWLPLIAEQRLALGRMQRATSDYALAKASLERALLEAVACGHLLVELSSAMELGYTVGYFLEDREAGHFWMRYADAAVGRGELRGSHYEARLHQFVGDISWAQEDYARSLAGYRRAHEIQRRLLGEDHPTVAMLLNEIAYLRMEQGDYGGALADYARAHEQLVTALGEQHELVAIAESYVADLYSHRGDYATAILAHRQVLERYARLFEPDHPAISETLSRFGHALIEMGLAEQALEPLRRSLAIKLRNYGEEHGSTQATRRHLERAEAMHAAGLEGAPSPAPSEPRP